MTLALRQIPFTNETGNDNIAQVSSILATTIEEPIKTYNAAVQQFLVDRQTNLNAVQPTPVYRTNYSNPASTANEPFAKPQTYHTTRDPINHDLYTRNEIVAVGAEDDTSPSAAQLPNREIPIDVGAAYMIIAADTIIHSEHYVPKGMTISEAVKTARIRTPATLDEENALACLARNKTRLSNGGVADFSTCRASAARNTLEMIAEGEAAPYNPTRYGISSRGAKR